MATLSKFDDLISGSCKSLEISEHGVRDVLVMLPVGGTHSNRSTSLTRAFFFYVDLFRNQRRIYAVESSRQTKKR